MARFHPDLAVGRFIPPLSFTPRSTALLNRVAPRTPPIPEDLVVEDAQVPGPPGAPPVPVRLYRPRDLVGDAPALVWVHGGGMISGNALIDERTSFAFARDLGITVASVDYRLAPGTHAPAQVEDCYAALRWLVEHAADRGVDPERVAVGGASAGGGLAAGLALLAHDRGEVRPAFQLLVYPMIDDRTAARRDRHREGVRVWTPRSNRYGWSAYLGREPGGPGVSSYAAPARRDDLSGLPDAWIGVGTLDLFHDEDVRYARRLREAGVACELEVVPGAFHGFDAIFPGKPVSRDFWRAQAVALQRALRPEGPGLTWA
ncbi:Acetyl esterase/lipase [Microlunatus sagamiharensis]|uniref:Acetyl esterase/lipase n=1 Tax=Microlunatus sagamiharensis TaxID=546874 RepID=A0A1H2M042_9ACTN|nr:alpha/beta hydrolase [Microlunatus sagamiharensis]SDU86607.1 Acetyl esterase/lipase [Microlunatus sagamiharensis]